MRLVGAAPFAGSKATLDRPPWKGADGGLRILLVLRFLHNYYDYGMTATIGSKTIQRSTRAGTMVTGIFITLATWNTGCRWSATYNTVFHPIIPALCCISIPVLCQLRERAYYARNYAGIIASSLVRGVFMFAVYYCYVYLHNMTVL